MKNLSISGAIFAFLFVGVLSLVSSNAPVENVYAQAADVCPEDNGWTSHINVNNTSYHYVAPDGFLITDSCYKAGTTLRFAVYNPAVSEVTLSSDVWNKDGCPGAQGCNFQNISHASFLLTQTSNTPTPTDTQPTPTDTQPTPTPTPNDVCEEDEEYDPQLRICIKCDGGGTCEVIIGDTPTPTPTNTQSPTPTTTSNNGGGTGGGDGLSDGRSDGRGGSEQKQGEVLGTSTMAPTGTIVSTIATIEQALGFVLMAAGALIYGKKKEVRSKKK